VELLVAQAVLVFNHPLQEQQLTTQVVAEELLLLEILRVLED
jgi:hypothetical protein